MPAFDRGSANPPTTSSNPTYPWHEYTSSSGHGSSRTRAYATPSQQNPSANLHGNPSAGTYGNNHTHQFTPKSKTIQPVRKIQESRKFNAEVKLVNMSILHTDQEVIHLGEFRFGLTADLDTAIKSYLFEHKKLNEPITIHNPANLPLDGFTRSVFDHPVVDARYLAEYLFESRELTTSEVTQILELRSITISIEERQSSSVWCGTHSCCYCWSDLIGSALASFPNSNKILNNNTRNR